MKKATFTFCLLALLLSTSPRFVDAETAPPAAEFAMVQNDAVAVAFFDKTGITFTFRTPPPSVDCQGNATISIRSYQTRNMSVGDMVLLGMRNLSLGSPLFNTSSKEGRERAVQVINSALAEILPPTDNSRPLVHNISYASSSSSSSIAFYDVFNIQLSTESSGVVVLPLRFWNESAAANREQQQQSSLLFLLLTAVSFCTPLDMFRRNSKPAAPTYRVDYLSNGYVNITTVVASRDDGGSNNFVFESHLVQRVPDSGGDQRNNNNSNSNNNTIYKIRLLEETATRLFGMQDAPITLCGMEDAVYSVVPAGGTYCPQSRVEALPADASPDDSSQLLLVSIEFIVPENRSSDAGMFVFMHGWEGHSLKTQMMLRSGSLHAPLTVFPNMRGDSKSTSQQKEQRAALFVSPFVMRGLATISDSFIAIMRDSNPPRTLFDWTFNQSSAGNFSFIPPAASSSDGERSPAQIILNLVNGIPGSGRVGQVFQVSMAHSLSNRNNNNNNKNSSACAPLLRVCTPLAPKLRVEVVTFVASSSSSAATHSLPPLAAGAVGAYMMEYESDFAARSRLNLPVLNVLNESLAQQELFPQASLNFSPAQQVSSYFQVWELVTYLLGPSTPFYDCTYFGNNGEWLQPLLPMPPGNYCTTLVGGQLQVRIEVPNYKVSATTGLIQFDNNAATITISSLSNRTFYSTLQISSNELSSVLSAVPNPAAFAQSVATANLNYATAVQAMNNAFRHCTLVPDCEFSVGSITLKTTTKTTITPNYENNSTDNTTTTTTTLVLHSPQHDRTLELVHCSEAEGTCTVAQVCVAENSEAIFRVRFLSNLSATFTQFSPYEIFHHAPSVMTDWCATATSSITGGPSGATVFSQISVPIFTCDSAPLELLLIQGNPFFCTGDDPGGYVTQAPVATSPGTYCTSLSSSVDITISISAIAQASVFTRRTMPDKSLRFNAMSLFQMMWWSPAETIVPFSALAWNAGIKALSDALRPVLSSSSSSSSSEGFSGSGTSDRGGVSGMQYITTKANAVSGATTTSSGLLLVLSDSTNSTLFLPKSTSCFVVETCTPIDIRNGSSVSSSIRSSSVPTRVESLFHSARAKILSVEGSIDGKPFFSLINRPLLLSSLLQSAEEAAASASRSSGFNVSKVCSMGSCQLPCTTDAATFATSGDQEASIAAQMNSTILSFLFMAVKSGELSRAQSLVKEAVNFALNGKASAATDCLPYSVTAVVSATGTADLFPKNMCTTSNNNNNNNNASSSRLFAATPPRVVFRCDPVTLRPSLELLFAGLPFLPSSSSNHDDVDNESGFILLSGINDFDNTFGFAWRCTTCAAFFTEQNTPLPVLFLVVSAAKTLLSILFFSLLRDKFGASINRCATAIVARLENALSVAAWQTGKAAETQERLTAALQVEELSLEKVRVRLLQILEEHNAIAKQKREDTEWHVNVSTVTRKKPTAADERAATATSSESSLPTASCATLHPAGAVLKHAGGENDGENDCDAATAAAGRTDITNPNSSSQRSSGVSRPTLHRSPSALSENKNSRPRLSPRDSEHDDDDHNGNRLQQSNNNNNNVQQQQQERESRMSPNKCRQFAVYFASRCCAQGERFPAIVDVVSDAEDKIKNNSTSSSYSNDRERLVSLIADMCRAHGAVRRSRARLAAADALDTDHEDDEEQQQQQQQESSPVSSPLIRTSSSSHDDDNNNNDNDDDDDEDGSIVSDSPRSLLTEELERHNSALRDDEDDDKDDDDEENDMSLTRAVLQNGKNKQKQQQQRALREHQRTKAALQAETARFSSFAASHENQFVRVHIAIGLLQRARLVPLPAFVLLDVLYCIISLCAAIHDVATHEKQRFAQQSGEHGILMSYQALFWKLFNGTVFSNCLVNSVSRYLFFYHHGTTDGQRQSTFNKVAVGFIVAMLLPGFVTHVLPALVVYCWFFLLVSSPVILMQWIITKRRGTIVRNNHRLNFLLLALQRVAVLFLTALVLSMSFNLSCIVVWGPKGTALGDGPRSGVSYLEALHVENEWRSVVCALDELTRSLSSWLRMVAAVGPSPV